MRTILTALSLLAIFFIATRVGSHLTKDKEKYISAPIDRAQEIVKEVEDRLSKARKYDNSNPSADTVEVGTEANADSGSFDVSDYIRALADEATREVPNRNESSQTLELQNLLSGKISEERADSIKIDFYDAIDENFKSILGEGLE